MEIRDLVCTGCAATVVYATQTMKPALRDGQHLIRWSNARDSFDVEILSTDDIEVMENRVLCGHCFDAKIGDVLMAKAV